MRQKYRYEVNNQSQIAAAPSPPCFDARAMSITVSSCLPALCTPALCTLVLCTPVLCTPVLCTPALCTPVLCTPALCTPALSEVCTDRHKFTSVKDGNDGHAARHVSGIKIHESNRLQRQHQDNSGSKDIRHIDHYTPHTAHLVARRHNGRQELTGRHKGYRRSTSSS